MASYSVAARQPEPAASMMTQVDRLDLVVGYLEEMRGSTRSTSPLSSSAASTPPRSWGSCRPAKEALQEAQSKGSLVDRIALLESRVLKIEDGMEMSTSEMRMMGRSLSRSSGNNGDMKKKKTTTGGLKSLVKTCVRVTSRPRTSG